MPCNHCIASKNSDCSYKDPHPVANRRTAAPPNLVPANSNLRILENPTRSIESIQSIFHIVGLEDESQISVAPELIDDASSKDSYSSAFAPSVESHPNGHGQVLADRVRKSYVSTPGSKAMNEDGKPDEVFGVNFSTFEDVIVQDGDDRNVLRTKLFKHSEENPIQDMKGSLCKTRFFGRSHWMNCFEQVNWSFSSLLPC